MVAMRPACCRAATALPTWRPVTAGTVTFSADDGIGEADGYPAGTVGVAEGAGTAVPGQPGDVGSGVGVATPWAPVFCLGVTAFGRVAATAPIAPPMTRIVAAAIAGISQGLTGRSKCRTVISS
jgi:hypothetical protein